MLSFKMRSTAAPPQTADHVSSVPEPTSLVFLSLGLVATILWRKFRSAAKQRIQK